jgi:two-component system NarL family sensor kinase
MRDGNAARKDVPRTEPRRDNTKDLNPPTLEAAFRDLNSRVITLEDQERRRIARDLHDSLGQMIALLKINLDRISMTTTLESVPAGLLSESIALVGRMSTEVRTICYLLHPPLLDELGLVGALKGLADGFAKRSGIEVSLQIDKKFERLPSDIEISIYRIIQESLTNIHRHSGSSTAKISARQYSGYVQIEIEDAGRGMPLKKNSAHLGVGLRGMQERATQLRGTVEINSNGKGTTVIARLPVSSEANIAETEP